MTIHRSSTPWSRALLASSVLVPALALITAPAKADPAEALPTIVVSPTGTATPLSQVASSVTVITAADIEREQRRTVTDVLATVPGLNVVQTGGPGGTAQVYMRGTESRHVKVLIDGIDIGDPSDPSGVADISQLLAGDIARIEVLRGPQSGLYGSDSIGGVISVTTKKGAGPVKVTASAEGGSFGTFNQTAGFSGSSDKINYAFNIVHYRATSVPNVPDRLVTPSTQQTKSFYDNKTISARLGYDFNENFSVNWVGRFTNADFRYPSSSFTTQETNTPRQVLTRGEAVWSAFDGRVKNYFGMNYTNLSRPTTTSSGLSVYDGQRVKYDWRSVIQALPGQTVVLGADHQKDYYQNNSVYTPGGRIDVSNGNKGVYAELQSQFAERFFVVSNVRHDDNDAFGGHDTYRIAPAILVPGTETKLKASYGTGFKAPSLDQLYGSYDMFGWITVGNPNLKPEESKGWDAGFEQPLAGDRFRFGATYFHNDITNLIQFTSFGPYSSYLNVNQATTEGVEAFAAWTIAPQFSLRGDYTYTEANDAQTGEQLRRRPKHKGSVTAMWTPTEQWQVSGTVLSVSEWYDNDRITFAKVWTSGYTVVNLATEYKATANTTIFGRVDNLFNKHYENPNGYLRTGIGVFGGIRVATQ
ncbi:vitamin B12 transporter [Rhodopseudomonas faecalis]|uniref:Vitamin B12 transporter n=1 Tax=Rhodopseudomonas faecalis TaxID=99655 RepID=A0A318TDW6_9BRAD|nr:TonB-dependent receptor [Rhodopseudomonas faecalis]PYF01408.1 vitamin B12 transporter [Rhodopseudomonas faecalis]